MCGWLHVKFSVALLCGENKRNQEIRQFPPRIRAADLLWLIRNTGPRCYRSSQMMVHPLTACKVLHAKKKNNSSNSSGAITSYNWWCCCQTGEQSVTASCTTARRGMWWALCWKLFDLMPSRHEDTLCPRMCNRSSSIHWHLKLAVFIPLLFQNTVNKSSQAKDGLVSQMYAHTKTFVVKLQLF